MSLDYNRQFRTARIVIIAQSAVAIIITGLVVLIYSNVIKAPIDLAVDPLQQETVQYLLGGVLLLIALLYVIITISIRKITADRRMPVLKFWVKQLHSDSRNSAVSLLLVPPAMGEASIILSTLLVLLGAVEFEWFGVGAVMSLLELALAWPSDSQKEKLILLDKMVD